MTRPRPRRRSRPHGQTHCLAIYAASSRLDNTPYYHLCELQPRHPGWHLCWCGSAFNERGVIGTQMRLDLGEQNLPVASHEPR